MTTIKSGMLYSESVLPEQENLLGCRSGCCRPEGRFRQKDHSDKAGSRGWRESGFLPGDLQEKVDPYLRPLYDALYDVMGPDQTAKALERGLIEIAPLAYMRGRTLDDSFIILMKHRTPRRNR